MDEKITNTFNQIQKFCTTGSSDTMAHVLYFVIIGIGAVPGVLSIMNRSSDQILSSIFILLLFYGVARLVRFFMSDASLMKYIKCLKTINKNGTAENVADDFRTGKYLAEGDLVAGDTYYFVRGTGIIAEYSTLRSIGLRQIVKVDDFGRRHNDKCYIEIEIEGIGYNLCQYRFNSQSDAVFKELQKTITEKCPNITINKKPKITVYSRNSE